MKMAEVGINMNEMVELLNDNVETRWELIGPQEAKKYLETNTDNYRKPSLSQVVSYANDIKNETWEINGETIVFDEKGILRNGQHRLMAIIRAGKPIITLVVHKLPMTSLYDLGKKRSQFEYIQSIGIGVQNVSIGAVNILISGFSYGIGAKKDYSHGMVEKILRENMETIQETYDIACIGKTSQITRKSAVLACVFCLLKNEMLSGITLKKMFQIVNSGFAESGYESSPALALRMVIQDTGVKKFNSDVRRLQFDATYQAAMDFSRGIVRKKKYTLTGRSEKLFEDTRKQLGII